MNKKHKILFIDSDRFARNMYKIHAEKAGFDYAELEYAGDDFVEVVSSIKPDLISMDVVLGKGTELTMSGITARVLLNNNARTKSIPVLFLTNHMKKEDIMEAKESGIVDYIIKSKTTADEVIKIYKNYFDKQTTIYPNDI